jgi:hypothetical protein
VTLPNPRPQTNAQQESAQSGDVTFSFIPKKEYVDPNSGITYQIGKFLVSNLLTASTQQSQVYFHFAVLSKCLKVKTESGQFRYLTTQELVDLEVELFQRFLQIIFNE